MQFSICYKTSEEMQGNIGLAKFNEQEIWINDSFSEQTKKLALLHETLHILSSVYNMNLEEDHVLVMTHALLGLINDNPEFIGKIST